MKRRLRKKWHRRMLELRVIDISQNSFWRARLFDAPPHHCFILDRNHLEGVPRDIAGAIQARDLRYDIAKVLPDDADPMLSEGGLVVFRIRAREFPAVAMYSGNNPSVI